MSSPWTRLRLSHEDLVEAQSAARALAAELHLAEAVEAYSKRTLREETRPPATLHLDDVSAIPFLLDIPGVEEYQHRARVRAGTGDLFAASTEPTPGYEAYCAKVLDMGSPELILAEPGENKLAVAEACSRGKAFEQLCEAAKHAGGMLIHPYMGIADVWNLADALGEATKTPVSVLAPPPPITWIANDKQAFSTLVEYVLGDGWLVETHTSTEPEAMVASLRLLALRHDRVGLKRTRCASAMGNIVYSSESIMEWTTVELTEVVGEFLQRTEWPRGEEVLVVAWEQTDISPSTQLWIPPLGTGQPALDGIYEQILEGPEKIFLGSRPSRLPGPVNAALARSALEVAAGLQALGYVGRCSFDHLVIGDPEGDFNVVFVECNGRWGGTSTPMSLVDRLIPGARPPYRAQDYMHPDLVGVPFDTILDRVGDQLFDPKTQQGRYIFYNTGPLQRSGKLDVIALGETQEEAESALLEDLPRVLGVS